MISIRTHLVLAISLACNTDLDISDPDLDLILILELYRIPVRVGFPSWDCKERSSAIAS